MLRPIALLTDFGVRDSYVGVLKGVILSRFPQATLIDLTHAIPPGDIFGGAFQLRVAAPYLPTETVFLAVVDPGVGGARRPVCVRSGGRLFVGPDNGLLWLAATAFGEPEYFHLDRPEFWLLHQSATFHGRDLFAPVTAALAGGTPPEAVGSSVADPVTLRIPVTRPGGAQSVRGEVVWIDHYGNAITNLQPVALENHSAVTFTVGGVDLGPPRSHYGAALPGEGVVVLGSSGYYEIAVRDGSAAARFALARGTAVWLRAVR